LELIKGAIQQNLPKREINNLMEGRFLQGVNYQSLKITRNPTILFCIIRTTLLLKIKMIIYKIINSIAFKSISGARRRYCQPGSLSIFSLLFNYLLDKYFKFKWILKKYLFYKFIIIKTKIFLESYRNLKKFLYRKLEKRKKYLLLFKHNGLELHISQKKYPQFTLYNQFFFAFCLLTLFKKFFLYVHIKTRTNLLKI